MEHVAVNEHQKERNEDRRAFRNTIIASIIASISVALGFYIKTEISIGNLTSNDIEQTKAIEKIGDKIENVIEQSVPVKVQRLEEDVRELKVLFKEAWQHSEADKKEQDEKLDKIINSIDQLKKK